MAEIATLPKSELVNRLKAAKSRITNVKKQAEEMGERLVDSTVTVAGGITSGVCRGWNDDGTPIMVPGTEIPLDAAISVVALGFGITGMAGKMSNQATAYGAGVGAAAAAFAAKDAVQKAKKG